MTYNLENNDILQDGVSKNLNILDDRSGNNLRIIEMCKSLEKEATKRLCNILDKYIS